MNEFGNVHKEEALLNEDPFNETPFFEETNEKKNPKEFSETVLYRKTTDGWKLCD